MAAQRWLETARGDVARPDCSDAAARTLSGVGGFVRWREGRDFRVRGEMDPRLKWRDLFIEVEGARRVQMRCGFRPRDRDRTTEMMEEV